jgi:chromosome partitioning protein
MFATQSGARVILIGNQKGGSGKSTLAMHIAIALLKGGYRVTSIDLDYEQRTLTRYIENRGTLAKVAQYTLQIPDHICIDDVRHSGVKWEDSDRIDTLSEVLRAYQGLCDFILIDTPGNSGPLNVFAHGVADTIITPVNDSFLDLDVIFRIGPTPETVLKPSRYAETVIRALDARRSVSPREPDWIVVRNRISPLSSRNEKGVVQALDALAQRGMFRTVAGLVERVVYREFFPLGLTTFDSFETSQAGAKPSMSHVLARLEVRQLIAALGLPPDIEERAETVPSIQDHPAGAALEGDLRQLSIPDQ